MARSSASPSFRLPNSCSKQRRPASQRPRHPRRRSRNRPSANPRAANLPLPGNPVAHSPVANKPSAHKPGANRRRASLPGPNLPLRRAGSSRWNSKKSFLGPPSPSPLHRRPFRRSELFQNRFFRIGLNPNPFRRNQLFLSPMIRSRLLRNRLLRNRPFQNGTLQNGMGRSQFRRPLLVHSLRRFGPRVACRRRALVRLQPVMPNRRSFPRTRSWMSKK